MGELQCFIGTKKPIAKSAPKMLISIKKPPLKVREAFCTIIYINVILFIIYFKPKASIEHTAYGGAPYQRCIKVLPKGVLRINN